MAVREGRWDCQYCATVGILGRHKSCPVCTKSRPHNTKFYLPENAAPVTDPDQQAYAQLGPDWICEFCQTSNPATNTQCRSCLAPRGTSPSQQVREYTPAELPRSGDMDMSRPPSRTPKIRPATPPPQTAWWRKRPVIFGAVGVLFLFLCVWLMGGTTADVGVAAHEWERTITVEAYRTVEETDWSLPAGARLISEQEAIYEYDQVLIGYETRTRQVSEQVQVDTRTYVCGQRDLGNGFFEDIECTDPVYETQYSTETYEEPIYERVPVYRTEYTYEIDKWVDDRVAEANGRGREPTWPELTLADNERDGPRTEIYRIIFVDDDGETYPYELPQQQWREIDPEDRYEIELDRFGDVETIIDGP